MIDLFVMTGSFISAVAGRVVSSQIVKKALPKPIKEARISKNEKELIQLLKDPSKRKLDAEFKKRELELRAKISADNLRLMQKHQTENIELKLKEIQANYDEQHWAGILSREETIKILKQGQQENHFLILLSPPDVSPSCPLTFQYDLGKTLRSKVKEFVETYYPPHSNFPVQFFGKFFKSSIFDTEAVQLENLLSVVPTAVIFSDLTNKELLLHIHVWGVQGGKMSLSSGFAWKASFKKLLEEGMNEEDALDVIEDAMVQTHKLLCGFLTDLYFLQVNPLHQPQLFLIDKSLYPIELTEKLLRRLQQERRVEYGNLLLEKDIPGYENLEEWVVESPPDFEKPEKKNTQSQKVGNFIVNEGIAADITTGLMWCRFAHGQQWKDGIVIGDAREVTWDDTFEIAKLFNQEGGYGGFTDWRPPTIEELKTLIDKSYANYINETVFPNNSNGLFWSSSSYAKYSSRAWLLFFGNGNDYYDGKRHNYFVRLVRGTGKQSVAVVE
jgi:hypothetical protein